MTFRTVHQDEIPQIDVYDTFNQLYEYITPSLHAFNVCIHLNLLYKRIHSIASMPIFYNSHTAAKYEVSILYTLSILSYNLSYELNRLEKAKEEHEPNFNKKYHHYFDAIIEELKDFKDVIDKDPSIEQDYIITMTEFLNKLILKGFAELTKTYPEHGFYIKY